MRLPMHTGLGKRIYAGTQKQITYTHTDQEKTQVKPQTLKEVGKTAGKALNIIQGGVIGTN